MLISASGKLCVLKKIRLQLPMLGGALVFVEILREIKRRASDRSPQYKESEGVEGRRLEGWIPSNFTRLGLESAIHSGLSLQISAEVR